MNPWRAPPPPGAPFVLRNATIPAALAGMPSREEILRVDIGVADGRLRFVALAEAQTPCDWHEAEMAGAMVWPCFVEAHTHLDTTQIWPRSPNPDGAFDSGAAAIIADRESHWTAEDMRARMDFGLRCAYAHGVRAMRTHIGSQNAQIEQRWEIFRDLRDAWAGRIALQAAPLISTEALDDDAALARILEVVRKSDGVLGAFAPMGGNIEAQLARIFDAAERHDLALDFHADETAAPASQGLLAIARLAKGRRFASPIQVGHACSLAMQDEALIDETLDLVAEASIHIVTLPSCNLYLQDRRQGRTPRWRGITLLKEMRARGIPVSFGGDNCRDPFHPFGDFDMLEVFRDAVRIAHLEHPIGDWPRAVTTTPGALIAKAQGIAAEEPADLVLLRARSFNELLARPQADRLLVRDGAFVAADLPDYAELDHLMQKRLS
ncbi:MAG: cytosine deaminase [Hyphomonadaceae bacterium]|nr:cytosine deaminase [Hyphomonadaceae bacterium]